MSRSPLRLVAVLFAAAFLCVPVVAAGATSSFVPAPAQLAVAAHSSASLTLQWAPVPLNLQGYRTFLNGVSIGKTASTSWAFKGLSCGTSYTLGVQTVAASGRRSSLTTLPARTDACADTTPPTVPSSLQASNKAATSLTLSWGASSDNVGVAGYDVAVNGTPVGHTAGLSFGVTGLACGTSYSVGARAVDAAGNASAYGSLNVSTAACAPVTPSLTVDGATSSGFTAHWSGITADSFQLWIEPGSKASGALGGSTTSVPVSGLAAATSYTVKLDALQNGAWTTVVTTTATTAAADTGGSTGGGSYDYTVAAPVNPGATITNMGGLGVNVTTKQDVHDVVIDGTGDSGVLFQLNADGSSLSRVKMTRVAAGNSASYGKHGIYAKGRNLTLQDIDVSCSSYCASGISLRHDGALLNRFKVVGAPEALTYYETTGSVTGGTITIENGSGSFTGDTAIWVSVDDATRVYDQHFVITNVSFTGSGAFMKVDKAAWGNSTVVVQHCFLNGHPVTAADLPNVTGVTILN